MSAPQETVNNARRLSAEEQALVESFDLSIDDALEVEKLKDVKGWQIVMREWNEVRRRAFERILSRDVGETQDEKIGTARAINLLLNCLGEIMDKGELAYERKRQLLEKVAEGALTAEDSDTPVYHGADGAGMIQ